MKKRIITLLGLTTVLVFCATIAWANDANNNLGNSYPPTAGSGSNKEIAFNPGGTGSNGGFWLPDDVAFAEDRVIVMTTVDTTMQRRALTTTSLFGELKLAGTQLIYTLDQQQPAADTLASATFSLLEAAQQQEQIHVLTLEHTGREAVFAAIDYLYTLPNVIAAEPDYIKYLQDTPNDPQYTSQYNLEQIGMPAVWDLGLEFQEVVVAVLDTGIDASHPDLLGSLWINPASSSASDPERHGKSFVSDTLTDTSGHGTHVAGIIAASTNNGLGIAGIASNVKIMALKIFNDQNETKNSYVIQALNYLKESGCAGITNNSYGGPTAEDIILSAAIRDSDCLFVAAAGNSNNDNDLIAYYPANTAHDNVISVAATNEYGALWRLTGAMGTNYGATTVHLAAPGATIYSTYTNHGYYGRSGTSMAAPHVTATAALIKGLYPDMTALEIKERILNSVDPLPALSNKVSSGGRLNALAALITPYIKLDKSHLILSVGSQMSIQATVSPLEQPLVWESSAPQVVSVEDGVLTAHSTSSEPVKIYASVAGSARQTWAEANVWVVAGSLNAAVSSWEQGGDMYAFTLDTQGVAGSSLFAATYGENNALHELKSLQGATENGLWQSYLVNIPQDATDTQLKVFFLDSLTLKPQTPAITIDLTS